MVASISERDICTLNNGQTLKKYQLTNSLGAQACFYNLGAAWIEFKLAADEPNLVLGCNTAQAFIEQSAFLGATVGRYANRIAHGQFMLDGELVQLERNLAGHHLHGGSTSLAKKIWQSHIELDAQQIPTLTFHCRSQHGESGYPGNVDFEVKIRLTESNCVQFQYSATTDRKTIVNLTNHSYFNLDGHDYGNLDHHAFQIESTDVLSTDDLCIPTGEIVNRAESLLDFSQWRNIKQPLTELTDPLLKPFQGYDHCYCFDSSKRLITMARAKSSRSNRELVCKSDLPGMQFYSANFLQDTAIDASHRYNRHGAFCFEPGYWINSPNHTHFPQCIIDERNGYSAIIEYSFL
ncbi:aldose epimerase family protein [Reinekea thalattae]|uniref:Aldose 1-epimerase n=1 Tax=Reinekea thalattae TaxID=2593301 RepID=A0A5C8Z7G8_9GAMM|nr:aldose epimerase family protein [Reinekea thalattae]TXR53254.1 galactose mutarotase [Reinekea thalattae]